MRRPAVLLLACAAVATVLVAITTPATAGPLHMSQLLAKLPVTAEVNTGYTRSGFRHWIDANHNTCDTREEVLKAESTVRATTGAGCAVSRGRWVSAYDRKVFTAPGGLDIDHFVPLAEAWGSGARAWTAASREAYANDLGFAGSLIAVSATTNRSKGDKDPVGWLPPAASYRCTYAGTWIQVKYRWQLTIDSAERSKLARLAHDCKDPVIAVPPRHAVTRTAAPAPKPTATVTQTPSSSATPTVTTSATPTESPSVTPTETSVMTPSPTPTPTARATDPKYGTCADAKKYGHAPYYRGVDPEYYWYTDRDSDGIVCE